MTFVLSPYPLTCESLRRLEVGTAFKAMTLSELRVLPLVQIIRTMRTTRGSLLAVVIQEQSERAVLPLMLTLASFSRVKQIEVFDLEAETVRRVPRLKAFLGVLGMIDATLSGIVLIVWLNVRIRLLLRATPQSWDRPKSFKALYLKSNLMLGAKAGGSIGHIAGVANELLRINSGMAVVAPEPPPMVRSEARFFPIESLQSYGMPPEVNHFRFNKNCIRSCADLLEREQFDFIYQRLSLCNFSGAFLSRKFNLPLILEYNGSEVWISTNWGHSLKHRKLATLVEECCLRHAYRVVTVSGVLADELKMRGVPKEKIVWYPNCIDPHLFNPVHYRVARKVIRQHIGVKDRDLVVLFLGTFGLWHGAEVLAETAKQYFSSSKQETELRLKFVFVGDGLRLNSVRQILTDEIATGDVILTGLVPQTEAPKYLAAADIFVSPHVRSTDGSKFFGSPTKLFEYMAMQRPIVASKLDQLWDVLSPAADERTLSKQSSLNGNEAAILTEPGNAKAILRALLFLRDRPDCRRSLAVAARRKVLERYTWERHVEEIMRSIRNA